MFEKLGYSENDFFQLYLPVTWKEIS